MSEVYLKRTLAGLVADDADAVEVLKRFPLGTTVRCEIVRPRSVQQMRYYWSLMQICAENSDAFQTKEQVDQFVRLETGHVDLVEVGGVIYKLPRRIAFSALSQEEWNAFLMRARDVIIQKVLPTVGMPDLEDEIARRVA